MLGQGRVCVESDSEMRVRIVSLGAYPKDILFRVFSKMRFCGDELIRGQGSERWSPRVPFSRVFEEPRGRVSGTLRKRRFERTRSSFVRHRSERRLKAEAMSRSRYRQLSLRVASPLERLCWNK